MLVSIEEPSYAQQSLSGDVFGDPEVDYCKNSDHFVQDQAVDYRRKDPSEDEKHKYCSLEQAVQDKTSNGLIIGLRVLRLVQLNLLLSFLFGDARFCVFGGPSLLGLPYLCVDGELRFVSLSSRSMSLLFMTKINQ